MAPLLSLGPGWRYAHAEGGVFCPPLGFLPSCIMGGARVWNQTPVTEVWEIRDCVSGEAGNSLDKGLLCAPLGSSAFLMNLLHLVMWNTTLWPHNPCLLTLCPPRAESLRCLDPLNPLGLLSDPLGNTPQGALSALSPSCLNLAAMRPCE